VNSNLGPGLAETTAHNSPLVSVLINTRNRPEPLLRCLKSVFSQDFNDFEVLVLDDASREDILGLLREAVLDQKLRCFRSEHSLGVSGGRNFLMRRARGEIFIVIDDDAVFAGEESIRNTTDHFLESPDVGILAFKIMRHKDGNIDLEVPFSQRCRKKLPQLYGESRLVSHYIGAGHALCRGVIEQCGLYQENLFFGEEELDLSYRVIQAGLKILYTPLIIVHHYPETSVLSDDPGKRAAMELQLHVRNRIWLAYKHFPFPYLPVYLLVWISYWGVQAVKKRRMRAFLGGVRAGIRGLGKLPRTPLDKRAIGYLKNNWGRLWY
jgi:GT2 family glycosyltransferase